MATAQTIQPTKKTSPKKKISVPAPITKTQRTRHKFEGDTIKVVGDKIPVRENSRRGEIFSLFKDGMGVSEFISAARKLRGGAPDVQIALDKGYITLS
jgi:hypothetical protein